MIGTLARTAALALALMTASGPGAAQNSVNLNINSGGGRWAAIDMFARTNFGGQQVRLTTSVSDLRSYNISGRTQSFRAHGRWRLCNQTNFRGHCSNVRGKR